MRIAIVHDYLCGLGGAERVFQYICEEFPEADIYTLAYNPDTTYPFFKSRKIHTTWLNTYVRSMDAFRWSFPIATYVMESIDLAAYDLVLSSSATVGKYVKVPNGRHICYCYIPTRAIWHFDEYFGNSIKSRLLKLVLPYLKKRDFQAAQRVDDFVAISNVSKSYIQQYYDREAKIVFSPINLQSFYSSAKKGDYYLVVSRLEYWKRVDFAVEAFNSLGLPLKIIGTGKEEKRLRSLAKDNISFLGAVDDETLAREYSEAKAVVFTPFLEYGLIPLEANASGTPVICLGKGGVTEIMVPKERNGEKNTPYTAVFFKEQTAENLIETIHEFETCEFDSEELVKHARKWDVPVFKNKIREIILQSAA